MVLKTTSKGEIVWKIQGPPPDIDAYKPGADGKAKAYNPTNVAIAPNGDIYVGDGYGSSFVNQYNSKAEYIRTFGGRGAAAGQLAEPHGIWVDERIGKSDSCCGGSDGIIGCSDSRWTANTWISLRVSACLVISMSMRAMWLCRISMAG